LSITPNPLTITLPRGAMTGTGVVTLTNTAAAGGAQVTVTGVNGPPFFLSIGPLAGPDTCTGATLAPGATCIVTVRFSSTRSPRGVNRNGTITFYDNGVGNAQTGNLVGFATP
jgi:hypothetical protein